jgi:glycyl-tRNA synthetase beta chain
MADLLLELFSEEMPARMQVRSVEQLQELTVAALKAARLEHGTVEVFSTPRRLAIMVRNLPASQPDRTVERKGPKVSAPEQAIQGFCASVGMSKDKLTVETVGKDAIYFAVSEEKGMNTAVALKSLLEQVISSIHWQKSMRWSNFDAQWVRPLRSILCVFDNAIIPLQWHHITASNLTKGHRFMSGDDIKITHPSEYETRLQQAYVIANRSVRKAQIAEQMLALAKAKHLHVKEDEGLLEEVTGLVEYPVAVMGSIDAKYLNLPPEVLVLEMRHHQKYFALTQKDGTIAPYFITIANIKSSDDGAQIRAGNERVLRARLDDGVFYYDQDTRKTLDVWAEKLSDIIFHKQLGTIADKVERIKPLAAFLAVFVPHANITHVLRAAALCKADLGAGMVGEFPELQGIMGQYYAKAQGEPPAVSKAIAEHYMPVGAQDSVPNAPEAIALSLADKLDSLVSLFSAGEVPTGSKDPFALRRAALGIIRIIREHSLRIHLNAAISKATQPLKGNQDILQQQIFAFIIERLKVSMKTEHIRHDVIDAVISNGDDDVMRIIHRAEALQAFLDTADGANMMTAIKRAYNILRKEEEKDAITYDADMRQTLLSADAEIALYDALCITKTPFEKHIKKEEYRDAMHTISRIREPLDAFFTEVMVNVDDASLRENRLHLLAMLRELCQTIADFNLIEG